MVIGTVNSSTMEINYEDMCILQFGQSQQIFLVIGKC